MEWTLFCAVFSGWEPWPSDVCRALGVLVSQSLWCLGCDCEHNLPVFVVLYIWQNCRILDKKNTYKHIKQLLKRSPCPPASLSCVMV